MGGENVRLAAPRLLFRWQGGDSPFSRRLFIAALLLLTALALGAFSTSIWFQLKGLPFLQPGGTQHLRHRLILEGAAGNPWQYRVLSAFLVEAVIQLFRRAGLPLPIALAFLAFRVAQDTAILLVSAEYYRRLGLSLAHALVGMALLAWGISHSSFNSDFQFNTFFDILFYLLAALAILNRRILWIVPLTILAALNRETGGLIPFLLLGVALFVWPRESLRRVVPVFLAAVIAYVAIFFGLRLIYAPQEVVLPYGLAFGRSFLRFNLLTWGPLGARQLLATFSIIPLVALVGYRTWPPSLRVFFWVVVPLWFAVHLLASVFAESRLLLVPQALVFIPGALLYLAHGGAEGAPAHAPGQRHLL